MSMLTLATARALVRGALEAAREREARPLAVIVLDAGGHTVAFEREDGASLFRHDIARAKAMGALGMGLDSAALAERAAANPAFFQSVSSVVRGAIAFSAGGVLLREGGTIVGAIGISGDTAECDEACARAALAKVGPSGREGA